MVAVDFDERVDRLDDARAGRPPAADARRQAHDCDLATLDRRFARARGGRRNRLTDQDQIRVVDVADIEIDRQAVSRQSDPAALKVVAQLLVLDGVKAVFAADACRFGVPLGA